jgi:hypothetical protein
LSYNCITLQTKGKQWIIFSFVCIQEKKNPWESVVHTCNPSYSGGRDQKDLGLKPRQIVAEWLKVKAWSSSSSTTRKKEKQKKKKKKEKEKEKKNKE